jgi:xanthine dehydrogenase/oxidase
MNIGGNIATASPISDLNPLWAAMDCELLLRNTSNETRKVKVKDFFLGYRKIDLKENEIIESIFVPTIRENEFLSSFKQSKRRDDDIAIVTGAFRVHVEKNKNDSVLIKECSISLGFF